jgi:hydroxymethylglutaryl-CoA lyase
VLPTVVEVVEVGPREGFQYEGIAEPHRISTESKQRLIEQLAKTGLRRIQVTSFVHPRQVPQMADAEQLCALLTPVEGVEYSAVYLNDVGLERARKAPNITVTGKLTLTASAEFARRNQHRTLAEDHAMQERMARLYQESGIPVTTGSIMAAFGCNYEGKIPLQRVVELAGALFGLAEGVGDRLETLSLADTMGWGNPEQVGLTVREIKQMWPGLRIGLHLHDTRGLGIANAYAAIREGVDLFDSAVGGLGGCPFAGHQGAAGNIATEELVFLCDQLGIATGVSLQAVIECGALAEEIVGHPLPSRLLMARNPCPA